MPELKHHGVKGMRWGVRKQRDTNTQVRQNRSKFDDMLRGKEVIDGIVLKKGTKFQRIVTNSNAGIEKGVYTSYRSRDKDLYKGVLGRMRVSYMMKTEGTVTLKELTMTAKKDIRLPSKKTRIDEFRKLAKEDPEGVKALLNDHRVSRYRKKEYNFDSSYIQRNEKTAYQKFNDALSLGVNSKNGHVIQKYYDNLSKLGYDAIPDENDIRLSTFKADAPIIMFNTKESIGKTRVRDLTPSEVYSAYNRSANRRIVRNIVLRGNIGIEKLSADSDSKNKKYSRQLHKDKYELNKNYTMDDLGKDWGINRLSSKQIRKVSDLMDEGKTHEEAVRQVLNTGNTVVQKILSKQLD